MELKTKFEIGDLVCMIFSTLPKVENHKINMWKDEKEVGFNVFRVTEVRTQSCYAGTQVFYDVRPITVHYMLERKEDEETKTKTITTTKKFAGVSPGWGQDNRMVVSFREDELKLIEEELKTDILSGQPEL